MTVAIELFAMAREEVGEQHISLEIAGSRISDVRNTLLTQHPGLKKWSLQFAIDNTYVTDNDIVADGDHVLVIPPVSGG